MDDNAAVDLIDFDIFARYCGIDCTLHDCGRANIEDCDNTVNEADLTLVIADWLTGLLITRSPDEWMFCLQP